MKRAMFSAAGFLSDDTDAALLESWGADGLPLTISPTGITAGLPALVGEVLVGTYTHGASVGEALAFSVAGELCRSSFGRGRLMHVASAATATANGTGQLLRAISTAKRAWATLHVLTVDGTDPSMTVIIQSDDNADFSSATTRATFTAATAATGELVEIEGPVTDTYWRARFTISGTSPEFSFVVALGFQEGV
jgi:hypothetical protein